MIELFRGEEAGALLQNADFHRRWSSLYAACPYGTCFQDIPFATAWYQAYAGQFEPLIVIGSVGGDALTGLLLLAVSKRDGAIVNAGAGQAEYHAWLAMNGKFIEPALDRLAEEFPNGRLEFLFLPPGVPLEWTDRWRSRCGSRSLPRPLLSTLAGNAIADVLRKKKKKMRLNQLERLGELSFERVSDPAALEAALDEIIPFYDFRQGAMYGTPPFAEDPLKKPFYLAMMRQPGLIHVTTLRLDGRLIAAHIGPMNKNQIVLGVIVQSPFLSRHSLGRIHILFLGLQAEKEGIAAIDLTPGAGYKEELASHHDEVRVLTVFFNHAAARRHRMKRVLVKASKRILSPVKLKKLDERIPLRLKRAAQSPADSLQEIRSVVWSRKETRVYGLDLKQHPMLTGSRDASTPETISRDDLSALLRFEPAGGDPATRRKFLTQAIEWLEEGCHAYTSVIEGRLVQCGWLIEACQELPLPEVGQSHLCPPNSAAFLGFYTHPKRGDEDVFRNMLHRMMADASGNQGTEQIILSLAGDDRASIRIAEETGFRLEAVYHQTTRYGKTTRGRHVHEKPL